jgi:hypothetical protein
MTIPANLYATDYTATPIFIGSIHAVGNRSYRKHTETVGFPLPPPSPTNPAFTAAGCNTLGTRNAWTWTAAAAYVAPTWTAPTLPTVSRFVRTTHHTTHHHQPIPPRLFSLLLLLVLGTLRKIYNFAGNRFAA